MFIPHLAIENDFFHSAFVNPCMMQNKRRSQSGVRLTAHLPNKCIMGNYCTRWCHCFQGLSLDGGRADFSKKPPLIKIYQMSLISAISSRWTVPLRDFFVLHENAPGRLKLMLFSIIGKQITITKIRGPFLVCLDSGMDSPVFVY
jgi:hypothetical protein